MDVHDHQPEQPHSPSPRKSAGFDPFLLNPASPSEEPTFLNAPPLPSLINGINFPSSPNIDIATPFDTYQRFDNQQLDNQSFLPAPHVSAPHTSVKIQGKLPTAEPVAESMKEQSQPQPMVIERTPTPLPEFHVSDSLLYTLKSDLRDTTEPLTVEQLEQLRATCLGCIWRQRSEWNRDALVRQLKEVVKEFVEEVAEDMLDSASHDQSRW